MIDSGQDEFIPGQDILLALEIDVDRQLKQLAAQVQAYEEAMLCTGEGEEAKATQAGTVEEAIEVLIAHALIKRFPKDREVQLRENVNTYYIWRLRLEDDNPAQVPPLEIRLKKNAALFRCKARKYPPHIRAIMRVFNGELKQLGWVYEKPKQPMGMPCIAGKEVSEG